MSFAHINADNTKLLLREGDNKIGVYRLPDPNNIDAPNPVERIGEIVSRNGMNYQGVRLSDVRLDKAFTDEEKQALRQYGAVIDEY